MLWLSGANLRFHGIQGKMKIWHTMERWAAKIRPSIVPQCYTSYVLVLAMVSKIEYLILMYQIHCDFMLFYYLSVIFQAPEK